MNVLFLSYNGLLEPILPSQAIPYLKALAKSGYGFTLLTYEKKKDLERIGRAGVLALKENLKKDGIEWQYLRYHKNPPLFSTMFDLLAGMFRAFSLIRSRRINIVHVRGITPGIIMLMLSKAVNVKVLFDMRGLLAEEYVGGGMWKEGGAPFRIVKRAEKKLLMQCDAVTVLTQKHLDLNRSLDYLAGRNMPMEVVPCCVDTSKFDYAKTAEPDLRKKLGLQDKFVLMYPGKLGSFYFVDEMVLFFANMLKVMPEAVFFVLTHDDPGPVMKKISAAGIPEDKVIIKNNVPFDDMPSYMRIADAGIFFINPYKKIGSSPIKMGEFLSSGVPVIINPGVGDTEELVRENRVGVVVDKFEDRDFSRAVDELLELRKDPAVLRKRCRDTAIRYLSNDDAVKKYAKIYGILAGEA